MRLVIILLALLLFPAQHVYAQHLELSTYSINKSQGFAGVNVLLTGEHIPGAQILVAITGPTTGYTIWKKEPLYGFWRNSKKYTIPAIFSFLQVSYSTNWQGDKYEILRRLNLDLKLSTYKPIEKYSSQDLKEFNDFVAHYYEDNGFLNINTSNVEVLPDNQFRLVIKIAENVPIGKYQVKVFQLVNDVLVHDDLLSFDIEQSDLDFKLQEFSQTHPTKYATMAILMAITIGLSMGYLFNGFRPQK